MGRFRDYRDLPPHYMRLEEGVFEAKGAGGKFGPLPLWKFDSAKTDASKGSFVPTYHIGIFTYQKAFLQIE